MDQIKRTYRDITHFIQVAEAWQLRASKQSSAWDGFKYGVSRVLKSMIKAREDFNERQAEININCAKEGPNGEVLSDSRGGPIFTKEMSKHRNSETRKLMEEEVSVGCYFPKRIPDDLTPFQIDAFEGFLIQEIKEPQEAEPQGG